MKYILLFLPLAMMAYEDFRHRAIHWVWLLLLTAGIVWAFPTMGREALINLMLIAVQLGILTLYFSIKQGRLVYLPDGLLGWGDILFYIPLCLLLSPENLVCFTVVSMLLTLVGFAAYSYLQHSQITIPLAGCFSLCLMGTLVLGMLTGFDVQRDSIIREMVMNY